MVTRKIVVRRPGYKSNSGKPQRKSESKTKAPHLRRLEVLDSRPHRNSFMHWSATILALLSLGILIFGMIRFRGPMPLQWVWLDLGVSIFFFFEFFTRSGFHWHGLKYARTHIFDFIAIVPVLLFLHHAIFIENFWVWIILISRSIRVIDRILGDGFLEHNFFALLEGLETEITDKVVVRVMDRIQKDLVAGKIGHSTAKILEQNRANILRRIKTEYPFDGMGGDLARFVGLEAAIDRIEERIYDAIADVLNSPEVDTVVQEDLDTVFAGLRADIGNKEWRNHLGLKHLSKRKESEETESESENNQNVKDSQTTKSE
jgi:hypothetical protein